MKSNEYNQLRKQSIEKQIMSPPARLMETDNRVKILCLLYGCSMFDVHRFRISLIKDSLQFSKEFLNENFRICA